MLFALSFSLSFSFSFAFAFAFAFAFELSLTVISAPFVSPCARIRRISPRSRTRGW
jgi:hypothetical protein